MKAVKLFLMMAFLPLTLFAQNGSWWQPALPAAGDSISIFFDPALNNEMPNNPSSLVMHWGVNETGSGNWQAPPAHMLPPGTVMSGIAARTPLARIANNVWVVTIPTDSTIATLHYVVNDGTPSSPGSNWAHNTGGANWDMTVFQSSVTAVVLQPEVDVSFADVRRAPAFASAGDTVHIVATAVTPGSSIAELAVLIDDVEVARTQSDTVIYDFLADNAIDGFFTVSITAQDTLGARDTTRFAILLNPTTLDSPVPDGMLDGINIIDNSTVTLSLFAPFKEFVYVIGDFTDWLPDPAFFMTRDKVAEDSVRYWLTLDGLDPETEYGFQYLVDGQVRVADPYAQLILTPQDGEIESSTFANLKPYPGNETNHNVSVFKINQTPFEWQVSDFQRPPKEELVIYELLIRDFIAKHDYATMVDTLDYLERLGVNAIELLPVTEFEGNESWGYNPAFYFTPDKYYGPANDLKRFVDECHRRGIAVILDAVLNHSFGQHSLVRLYASGAFGPPTEQNPWYNVTARHPFNVGWDFNHESKHTKAFVDRVNRYWLQEFRVDGFRFDLSKGFTQTNSGNDSNLMAQFDASRIAILTRMADQMWQVDSTAYVILEHFADNEEEKVLSNHGMLLWGNLNTAYSQSAMGWLDDGSRSSDFSWGYYKKRGWSQPHLVTYMESHDEPWLVFKNLSFGRQNSSGSYNTRDLQTALQRIKLVASFFLTIPGPKMMWQFGELGYDQELPESGGARTAPKPILWEYNQDPNRKLLYNFMAELLKLRREHGVFRAPETTVSIAAANGPSHKIIKLGGAQMNVLIVGNFDVVPTAVNPGFIHGGMWYDYFLADSLLVDGGFTGLSLQPGEFHLYTDKNIGFPSENLITSVGEIHVTPPGNFRLHQNYPNPFNPETTIEFDVPVAARVTIDVFNVIGQRVRRLMDEIQTAGSHRIVWDGRSENGGQAASGLYILRMSTDRFVSSLKLLKLE